MLTSISDFLSKLGGIRKTLALSFDSEYLSNSEILIVQEKFKLSDFEKNILLICAGCILDPEISNEVKGRTNSPYPTFRLVLEIFEGANWESITPNGTLRKNNLVNLVSPQYFLDSPLLIDEKVLSMMLGVTEKNEIETLNKKEHVGLLIKINPKATWSDIVLPDKQIQLLREIVIHVKNRNTVLTNWGFENKYSRGLGVTALFHGRSGTGKTMACEVLACELGFDLFRVDLSQVINKYIGETEKNLAKIFDNIESRNAILLFDEADALFGKRSDVKDSHDRYANIEVGYLLSRMEDYRGLAILTTNLKSHLDSSFMRRLRFSIHFPFPTQSYREKIWRCVFPDKTPLGDINYKQLSDLQFSGGNIQNSAIYSAFLSADEGDEVKMKHLARAVRVECEKNEMTINEKLFESFTNKIEPQGRKNA